MLTLLQISVFSPSLSPENSDLHLSYFPEFVCCEVLDNISLCILVSRNVLSVAVFVIRKICKKKKEKKKRAKADLCLNLYPSVIILSLSLAFLFSHRLLERFACTHDHLLSQVWMNLTRLSEDPHASLRRYDTILHVVSTELE